MKKNTEEDKWYEVLGMWVAISFCIIGILFSVWFVINSIGGYLEEKDNKEWNERAQDANISSLEDDIYEIKGKLNAIGQKVLPSCKDKNYPCYNN